MKLFHDKTEKTERKKEKPKEKQLWCYKKWARITAMILCVLSLHVMAGSLLAVLVIEDMDVYEQTKEEVMQEAYQTAQQKYSIWAMTEYQDDFAMKELEKTNFRYGVIQTDSIKDIDLNDTNVYEVCNFDKPVSEDMLYIYSCNMGQDTSYTSSKSYFGYSYIYNNGKSYKQKAYPIEACYYVRNLDKIYYLANGKFYGQLGEVFISDETGTEKNIDLSGELVKSGDNYAWKDGSRMIQIDGMTYYLSDINVLTSNELEQMGREILSVYEDDISVTADAVAEDSATESVDEAATVESYSTEMYANDDSTYVEYEVQNGEILAYEYEFPDTKPYYVLSYVNEPLETTGSFFNQGLFGKITGWFDQDFFVELTAVVDFAFAMRYGMYVVLAVSMVVFFASLAVMMIGAGHRTGTGGIVEGKMDKIPLDLYIGIVFAVFCMCGILIAEAAYGLPVRFVILLGFFAILLMEISGFSFLYSLSVRLKLGKWWRNTLIYRILSWCKKWLLRILGSLKKMGNSLSQALPFLWKAWLVMGILAVLEIFGLVASSYSPDTQLFLWFVEKVAVYGFITICLLQLNRLIEGAKKIAKGEVDSKIDTSRMFWDFKEHGEDLNSIQEGIGMAVAERMKSERFKTELITNVSHDIKTPLTSIINYVDLLEKEDIDNATVQEYLEVLHRQSARLKKLIEDLIEASKASTGNLAVAYERCDAKVMLTQTIGEFEEKLKAGQIELIVQDSKEPLYIQADPRHLWRIFDNLMNNICKYAQASTRAYVNIENDGKNGKIIFRNISKYALNIDSEALMERFVRGDSSRNTEGNGLGISIAKSLTELMQGRFELIVDGDLFKVILTFPLTGEQDSFFESVD